MATQTFRRGLIDAPETNMRLVETVQKHFPHLEMMVRARNRIDAYALLETGVNHIYRESLHTSLVMGVDVLRKLGFRHYSAHRAAQKFIEYDEASLRNLAKERHNQKQYISKVRESIESQEKQLQADLDFNPSETDHAWDSEEMRNVK